MGCFKAYAVGKNGNGYLLKEHIESKGWKIFGNKYTFWFEHPDYHQLHEIQPYIDSVFGKGVIDCRLCNPDSFRKRYEDRAKMNQLRTAEFEDSELPV